MVPCALMVVVVMLLLYEDVRCSLDVYVVAVVGSVWYLCVGAGCYAPSIRVGKTCVRTRRCVIYL